MIMFDFYFSLSSGPKVMMKTFLFFSIRYHNFNPNYIHERLKQLGNRYDVRILLVQVDVVSALDVV